MSVDVAFYFKLVFGREERRFESGSWFWGVGVVGFIKWSFVGGGVWVVLL